MVRYVQAFRETDCSGLFHTSCPEQNVRSTGFYKTEIPIHSPQSAEQDVQIPLIVSAST